MSSQSLQGVLARLRSVRRSGEGHVALCPAHDDHHHSLSIADGDRGVLLNCHAGCPIDDIARAIDVPVKDLFYEERASPRVVAEYEYRDEGGKLVYVVERREPKDFRQRRPDGAGGWTWNLKGVTPLPYRLPELLAADLNEPVFIVEGEKDVDALYARGFVATCNSGGAGKWREELSTYLNGRHVIILPDNDEAGRKHAQHVEESLTGHAAGVTRIELEGLKPKGDVSDWFAAGHAAEDLRALQPREEDDRGFDRFVFAHEWEDPEPQQWTWQGWIPKGFITTLYATGGSSKSFLSQYIGIMIAMGKDVFGARVDRGPVLFLDGELDRDSWLRRGYMFARALQIERLPVGVVYRRVSTSLLDPKTRRDIVGFVRAEKPSLVIIDSFTACLPGADTNSLDDVVARMKAIEELGTVLMIDHTKKTSDVGDATPIGSVAKWNFARSAIQLTSSPAGGTVMKHTKSNFGPLSDTIAYTLDISGGQAFVRKIAHDDERLEGVEGVLPVQGRIALAFAGGEFGSGGTAADIAEHLSVSVRTVRNKLGALKKRGLLALDGRMWRQIPGPGWRAYESK